MAADRDIEEEQEILDHAYRGLEAMRRDASRMLDSVLDLGRGGTFQSRTERDIVVRTSLARLAQLDIGDQALCFGRIDRLPAGDGDGDGTGERAGERVESFHIGRLAVSGESHEPLVVDWRAPVAEPFYRATGLDPQGLARRRHLAVRGRTVTGLEDEYFARPDGTVPVTTPADGAATAGLLPEGLALGGPGALLAALGQARTGHMGDIVGTIQREQDEIIRAPLAGVLMVQGGPGTGKTAVALHRAAYLLYTHRFPLERQGVLVVGPNPLFLRYIEQVLPSLGEAGVTLSTVSGLVPEVRVRGTDPPEVARLKGEARMARVVAQAVRTRQRPLRRDVTVPYGATTLRLTAADSVEVVAQARRRPGTHNARRRYVEQQVVRRLAEQYQRFRRDMGGAPAGEGQAGDDWAPDDPLGPAPGDPAPGDPAPGVPAPDGLAPGVPPVPAPGGQLDLFGPGGLDSLDSLDSLDGGAAPAGLDSLDSLDGGDGTGSPDPAGTDPAGTDPADADPADADAMAAAVALAAAADELDLEEVGRQLRRTPALAEALDRMWPRLAPHELLHDLFGARPLLAAAGRGVLTSTEQASLYRPRSSSLDQIPWTAADAALVDEARTLLGPRRARHGRSRAGLRERTARAREEVGFWPAGLDPSPMPVSGGGGTGWRGGVDDEGARAYGHIVVDEVQDLSPLQLRMLARRSLSGSVTAVGDIAQATGPWAPQGWDDVAAHLTPTRDPRLVELTVSYRTPAEVVEVAARVLAVAAPDVTPPRPVRRSGARPELSVVAPADLARRVAEVAEAEVAAVSPGRTAVLVPDRLFGDVAVALAEQGHGAVDPRDPGGEGLAAPLVLLPAGECNGLEFDSVVVVEPARIAGETAAGGEGPPPPTTRGLRTLYVALTRPTRRLAVVSSMPLPAGLSLD